MKYRQYISYSLLAISGVFLLCTVFATNTGLANGLVTGKVLWFHLAMLLLAACSLVAAILTKPAKPFDFSVADGLVLVLAVIVALTYNRQLDPEPEKMLFGGQLVVLWFLLRFLLTGWPQLQLFFLAVVVATGGIEAVSGMRQLHGFEGSNHSLFKLTGDFYNPGPYSGYLAIILPVCLWMILRQTKNLSALPGMDRFAGNHCRASCRNEPDGMDSGCRFMRMGVLGATDRMGKD